MKKPLSDSALEAPGPLDLSDEDILSAMKEMGGYIDITAGDFQTIYRLAHRWPRSSGFSGSIGSTGPRY